MADPNSSPSGAAPQDAGLHERWFQTKIEKALHSAIPYIPHDEVMDHIRHQLFKYAPDLDL